MCVSICYLCPYLIHKPGDVGEEIPGDVGEEIPGGVGEEIPGGVGEIKLGGTAREKNTPCKPSAEASKANSPTGESIRSQIVSAGNKSKYLPLLLTHDPHFRLQPNTKLLLH